MSARPPIAAEAEWQKARDRLLRKEKAATRLLDALAAERRRLPMVPVARDYVFEGENGPATLVELFDGRRQLIVYHFMFGPDWDVQCAGCSRRIDDVGHLAHLHARDTTFVVVALAPYPRLAELRRRKGWTVPFFSSHGTEFNADMGATTDRGLEPAGFRHLLDLTPYGRQEDWEDSPDGWPQSPTYGWGSDRDD